MGDAPLAEFAMTKPDITKKTFTPIQPNQVTDASFGRASTCAKMREVEEVSEAQE